MAPGEGAVRIISRWILTIIRDVEIVSVRAIFHFSLFYRVLKIELSLNLA